MSRESHDVRRLPYWFWPERAPRRWIHGIGGLVVGGTFVAWIYMMAYGFVSGLDDVRLSQLFGLGAASTVAVLTSLITILPYALGSLAVRTSQRPYWIVGACAMVGLLSLLFRIYAYGIAGGGQVFGNMTLHVVPFSALVLAGWTGGLLQSYHRAEDRSPTTLLIATVGSAAILGMGASVAIWLLRGSPLWFKVGGPLALASVGLGLWATRRAREDVDAE